MENQLFHHPHAYPLESGGYLAGFQLAYATYGTLDSERSNVVWICHALTANANAAEWWEGIVGKGKLFDPTEQFIVCANVLGSCYGSTHALSVNPESGTPYYHDFPLLTIRDLVGALDLLRNALGIRRIHTCIGGSLGGQQALEWAIRQPDLIEHLVLIATNARHSAWGIAFNESQRLAIEADPTWRENRPDAGSAGLKAARATALLSYRNYDTYVTMQTEPDDQKTDAYRAAGYQQYQGDKLVKRFNAFAYWALSKAMDSHHVGRGRKGIPYALQQVRSRTLALGIGTDLLFPVEEQRFLAKHIPHAHYEQINSLYGHDGFLIENEQITQVVTKWRAILKEKTDRANALTPQ
ncbi:MAG: homoserine O-acetyltransferase [Ferruginibacter sp.]|nr:homoserine O-acetyltransferase [Cytophagales bacterium]